MVLCQKAERVFMIMMMMIIIMQEIMEMRVIVMMHAL